MGRYFVEFELDGPPKDDGPHRLYWLPVCIEAVDRGAASACSAALGRELARHFAVRRVAVPRPLVRALVPRLTDRYAERRLLGHPALLDGRLGTLAASALPPLRFGVSLRVDAHGGAAHAGPRHVRPATVHAAGDGRALPRTLVPLLLAEVA